MIILTKADMYDYIASLPDVIKQNEVQLRTRCFLCGDSKKNPNKKRLGIKITEDPDEPIVFNCFNCFSYGIFTVDMLHQMGGYDPDMDIALRKINNRAFHNDGTKVNKYKNTREINIQFPPLYNRPNIINKIRYVYSRIGYKIPPEDFDGLKIIWSLWDFIDVNKLPIKNPNKIDMLDRDYVGFLTMNNDYIVFRDITNNPNQMRYIKYNIFDVMDNTNSFYMMRASANTLSEEPLEIIIAEGTFDLLGIRYNVMNNDTTNKLYIALCNGNFVSPLQAIFNKGFVGENITVSCYQDNDTRVKFRNIKNLVLPYTINPNNFNVYYNTKRKDFGYPKNEIVVDKLIV